MRLAWVKTEAEHLSLQTPPSGTLPCPLPETKGKNRLGDWGGARGKIPTIRSIRHERTLSRCSCKRFKPPKNFTVERWEIFGFWPVHSDRNFDQDLLDLCYKFASVSLCPNVTGQLTVDLMVKPTAPGDESYAQYEAETSGIFNSLKSRAA